MLPSRLSTILSTSWACSRSKCVTLVTRHSSNNKNIKDTTLVTYKLASPEQKNNMYETPSPYKIPGPRRYGYECLYKKDGLLPRDDRPNLSLEPYQPKNQWDKEEACFGQNDYIDILGDGDIHPAELIKGPRWLIGYKGNERDRLMRQMEFDGEYLKKYYPTEWTRVDKRIRYLTKWYNRKRPHRWYD